MYVRSAERVWRQSGIHGVELSPLYTDLTRHTMTTLVRMAPGAQFLRHRHVTDEQFYMLEGDGHVQGQAWETRHRLLYERQQRSCYVVRSRYQEGA